MKRLKSFGKILLGLVRELSDESAYRRHLAVHGRQHSPEEWRKFSEHHLRAKYSRAKCCAVALAAGLSLGAAVAEAQTAPLTRQTSATEAHRAATCRSSRIDSPSLEVATLWAWTRWPRFVL
jgi:hypothetical protein